MRIRTLICFLLAPCLLQTLTLFGKTHSDSETIYPEISFWFRPTDPRINGSMTVTYTAYEESVFVGGVWVLQPYTETATGTWTANTLSPPGSYEWDVAFSVPVSIIVRKGMPLDVMGKLKIEGVNVAGYLVQINLQDDKYKSYMYEEFPGGNHLVSERNMLIKGAAGVLCYMGPCPPVNPALFPDYWNGGTHPIMPLPHEHKLFFKRVGESGELAGKASSVMAGWRNFKMSLGYGKTGKSLGYVNFWNGNEARLADASLEVGAINYQRNGLDYTQVRTPGSTFEFGWDVNVTPANYDPGEYTVRSYDNATQNGLRVNHNGLMIFPPEVTPIVKYKLHFDGPATANDPYKTRVTREEGLSSMISEAYRKYDQDAGVYYPYCPPSPPCLTIPFGPFGQICPPPLPCYLRVERKPKGVLQEYTYDWVDSVFSGTRNAKAYVDTVVVNPVNGSQTRTIDASVGLSVPGDFVLSQINSRRQEIPTGRHDLMPNLSSFWDNYSTKSDISVSGSATYKIGEAEYYWAPNTGRHLKLRSKTEVTGGWIYYEYSDDRYSRGMVTRIVKPFGDAPTTAVSADTVSGTIVSDYTYVKDWDGSQTLPSTIVTKLRGSTPANDKVLGKTVFGYSLETHSDMGVRVAHRHDYFGPSEAEKTATVTKRFVPDAYRAFAHLPLSEERGDGTKTVWRYVGGVLDENTLAYSPYSDSAALVLSDPTRYGTASIQTWQISCYPSSAPGAVALPDDSSFVVPMRSTAVVKTLDTSGRLRKMETFVCQGVLGNGLPDWDLLESELHFYDAAGNIAQSWKLFGVDYALVYAATYTDGRKTVEKDRLGTERNYSYDSYGRIAKIVEVSSTGITGLTTPPALQTSYTYDCDNRVLSTAAGPVTGDNQPAPNALTTSTIFNRSGMPQTETAPGGYATVTDYASINTRVLTKTQKGLGNPSFDRTTVTTHWRDGRAKSISGTAVVESYRSYSAVDVGGISRLREISSTGNDAAHTFRGATNDYDWVGRILRTAHSNPPGTAPYETWQTFSIQGQAVQSVLTGIAPVVSQYDAFGQLFRSGMKLNAGSSLVVASTDRISEQSTFMEKDAQGLWWLKTVNKAYPTDNATDAVVVQETRTLRSGFPAATLDMPQYGNIVVLLDSYTIVRDAAGLETTTATWYNRDLGFALTQKSSTSAEVPDNTGSLNGRPVYRLSTGGERQDFTYDTFGRLWKVLERTGTGETLYRASSVEVAWKRNSDNTWKQFSYDPAGRVAWEKKYSAKNTVQPAPTDAGLFSRFSYNLRGQPLQVWGDLPHPTENVYFTSGSQVGYFAELQGQLFETHTYNGGAAWTGATWPTSGQGTVNKTRYQYFRHNGLLSQHMTMKTTAPAWQTVTYTYNARRNITQRTWDRGPVTTYTYKEAAGNNTGELLAVNYSDPTDTDLAYTYTRLGSLKTATDATGTRNFFYRASDRQIDYEQLPALYGASMKIGQDYDAFGRSGGYWFGTAAGVASHRQTYGYAPDSGRLQSVSSALGSFTYAYLPNSHLISTLQGPLCGGEPFVLTRQYAADSDLLSSWSTTLGTEAVAAYAYRYDDLNRLTKLGHTGRLYQPYGSGLSLLLAYNARSELENATTYLTGAPDSVVPATTSKLARRGFAFVYDNAGNRVSTTTDTDTTRTYTANIMGQYSSRQRPTFVEVSGLVRKDTTITAAKLNAVGFAFSLSVLDPVQTDQNYFHGKATRTSPSSAAYESLSLDSLLSGGTPITETRQVTAPPQTESITYDNDGNLTDDALWTYAYDSENRVRQIETKSSLPAAVPRVRLNFTYDYLGRRAKKEVRNFVSGSWVLSKTLLFAYNGWNLIGEWSQVGAALTLERSYTWGLDLSGGIQGAAGVGGLLGLRSFTANPGNYVAANDRSGNVVALLDVVTGFTAAAYEYSPFGETVRASGLIADLNPLQFSTKYLDSETRLLNFGYRLYSASLGRFLSRDSVNEIGLAQLTKPLLGAPVALWSHHNSFVGRPGKSAGLVQDTSLERASMPHTNDRQGGYRDSTAPGSVVANRKNSETGPGGGPGWTTGLSGAENRQHLYGYAGNNPYQANDPFGLTWGDAWNNFWSHTAQAFGAIFRPFQNMYQVYNGVNGISPWQLLNPFNSNFFAYQLASVVITPVMVFAGGPLSFLTGDIFDRQGRIAGQPTSVSVNGIFNTPQHADEISCDTDVMLGTTEPTVAINNGTHYVIPGTRIGVGDLLQVLFETVGFITTPSLFTADVIRRTGATDVIAHSQGASVVAGATRLLTVEQVGVIDYQGFGPQKVLGATMYGFHSAESSIRPGDPVPWMSPFNLFNRAFDADLSRLPRTQPSLIDFGSHSWHNYGGSIHP
jgi:RHS repeat-associated protein